MAQKRDAKGQFMAKKRARPFCFITDSGNLIGSGTLDEYALKSKQVAADSFETAYSDQGLKQPIYTPSYLMNLLDINTFHYRCCDAKARDTAGLGWSLKSQVNNPSTVEEDVARLFFNDFDTEVLYRFQFDYESIGYAALELVRVDSAPDGAPESLLHIPAHTIRRHKDGNRLMQQRGTKKVWFKMAGYEKDVHYLTGNEYTLGSLPEDERANEVLWAVNYTPRSDFYGLPDITPAIGTIGGDFSRREYNRKFFENFGVPAYAVWITGNYDPGEINEETGDDEVQTLIKEKLKELPKNPHSALVMSLPSVAGEKSDVEVHFEPLATDIKEASFRLFRQDNRNEVIVAHGVPPYRIGLFETGQMSGNLAEEATEIYKRSYIEPRQHIIEELINFWIIGGLGVTDWKWQLAEIDTKDEKHELDLLSGLFEKGAVTPNELRAAFADRLGLEPSEHPAMDSHYLAGTPITMQGPSMAVVGAPTLIQAGILTVNEVRQVFGLEGIPGGDEYRDPADAEIDVVERSLKDLRSKVDAAVKNAN